MAVNSRVYGTPEMWDTVKDGSYNTSIKIANFKNMMETPSQQAINYPNSLITAVTENLINTNTDIDISISPWKINLNSMFAFPKIPYVSYDNQAEYANIDYIDVYNKVPTSFIITRSGNQLNENMTPTTNKSANNFDPHFKMGQPKENFLNGNDAVFNRSGLTQTENVQLVTDFNFRDVLVYPRIIAENEIEGTTSDYNLESYFNSGYKVHPSIRYIYFRFAIKVDGEYIFANYLGNQFINIVNTNKLYVPNYTFDWYDSTKPFSNYQDILTPVNLSMLYFTSSNYKWQIKSKNVIDETNLKIIDPPFYGYYIPPGDIIDFKRVDIISKSLGIVTGGYEIVCNDSKIDTLKEFILKECAYLGFWFTTGEQGIADANNNLFGISDKLYLPDLDASSVTTGTYKYGAAAKNSSRYNLTDGAITNSGSKNPDSGDLTTQINKNKIGGSKEVFF